uniref:Uncharacterized protein n=1 Tax=Ananas comosus var. bracteatus TaxID=296719 RepID=A0A6V7P4L3_ANACO|nr:unnamed protein product [Ananas comosus var. bracteatus]
MRSPQPSSKWRMMKSKKILRSFQVRSKAMKNVHEYEGASGGVLDKAMIKKKMRVLRHLIPGATFLVDLCLLDQTLDYVISLRAQLDVMQKLMKTLNVRRSK